MTGLFGGGQIPKLPTPKVVRLPTETDPSIVAAGRRTMAEALKRSGRRATMKTDRTRGIAGINTIIGSTGRSLGA